MAGSKPGHDDKRIIAASTKEKSRFSAGPSCSHYVRTNGRPYLADWDSDRPDGSGLAAAVRASVRRPAAVRVSAPGSGSAALGSGSAGPDSGSGWTLRSPWLNTVGDNGGRQNWFQEILSSGGIIQWQRLGIRVAAEPKRRKLSMYKLLRRSFEMLPQQVPAVRKPVMTRRSGCRGHRRGIVEASIFR